MKKHLFKTRQRAERLLELPEGMLSGEARMEVYGNRRCVVEGDCRIRVYEEDTIRLDTGGGEICFRGRALHLATYEKHGAAVVGRIACIEFS